MSGSGLLIFDLDGMLFRTETITAPAVQRSFEDRSLPVPRRETILPLIGKPMDELRTWVRDRCPEHVAGKLFAAIG